jgi:hypothetical protein
MSGSVNMPGALALGDLASTTSVRVGRGGALVVDNSGTSAVGSVAVAGPLVSTSSLDIGANPLTCGALTCASVASTGAVTQPQYWIVASIPGTQSISNGTITIVSWTTSVAGTGITFSNPTTVFTIPVAGLYSVSYGATFAANGTGVRSIWGTISGTTVQLATTTVSAVSGDFTRLCGGFQYRFAANDTLSVRVFQTSGGALNIGGDAGNLTFVALNRLHE